MVIDARLQYITKWLKRAATEDDCFDKFFYAWIALVIAAQRLRTITGSAMDNRKGRDTDRDKVLYYFKGNQESIISILEKNNTSMKQIASRRGTNFSNPIVDTGNASLSAKFTLLSRHYINDEYITNEQIVEFVAELFNKVRNNLFHGIKVYDDREDCEIVGLISPILVEIVSVCEEITPIEN